MAFDTSAEKVPTRKIGRIESSILLLGWWEAGGPPYFPMPDINNLVRVRHICAERGVHHDCAPAYGKGMSEMLMYITYCYLESQWREAGLKSRASGDTIFTKCGLYWPLDSLMSTHADMHRSPDVHLCKDPAEVTPDQVRDLILSEFQASCVRMGVEYIHGYQVHWPLAKAHGVEPAMDWMLEGVLPAFAKLWKENRVGSIGFANVDLGILKPLQEKALALGAEMGEDGEGFAVHFIQNDRSMLGIEVHGAPFGERDHCFGPLAEYCKEQDIARVAYSSLGHGPPIPPPGKFIYVDHWVESEAQQREMFEYRGQCHQKFKAVAEEIGCTSPQMGLAWLMGQGLIPIFSATNEKFLIEDIESVNYIDAVKQASDTIDALCEDYRQGLWQIINKYGTKAKW